MLISEKRSAMIALLCAWMCLFAAYLLFAGQVSLDEVVAGSLCAAMAVLWWEATRRVSTHSFAFEAASWAAVGRACRSLPGATLSVALALLRSVVSRDGGEVAHWFFAHGQRTAPLDSGRRAVGVLAASLTPDSFVLRTPVMRDEIVVHALPRGGEPPVDPRWPI